MRRPLALLAWAALAGCAGPAAPPASAPDVQKVLAQVRARFANADRIRVETVVCVGGNMGSGQKNLLRTTWVKPGWIREERWEGETPDGEPRGIRICDGKTSWSYYPEQKSYYESEVSPDANARDPFLLGFLHDGTLAWSLIEPGREEELVFGGGNLCMPIRGGGTLATLPDAETAGRPCHVLTYTTGKTVQTFFLDASDGSPLRYVLENSWETPTGQTLLLNAVSERTRLETNFPIDPAQFRFTPPAGVTRKLPEGEEKLLALGEAAPDFHLTDVAGRPVSLSDFKGRVVLLNFWFLGCHACRAEFPHLQKLSEEMAGKDLVFLTIDTVDPPARADEVRTYLKDGRYTLPCLLKTGPDATMKDYHVTGCPTQYVIGRDGRISGRGVGARIPAIRRMLLKALAGAS